MAHESGLAKATRITLTPSGSGKNYGVEVKDDADATLATCDADGTIRDPGGAVLMTAPLRWEGRGEKPTDARVEIADADGRPLGTARVAKYGVGPRAKKATIDVVDPGGASVVRLEPQDRRGEELALTSGEAHVATVGIEQVKTGFLRKSRVYTVEVAGGAPHELRPLALATTIRYDALLNAVVSAVASD